MNSLGNMFNNKYFSLTESKKANKSPCKHASVYTYAIKLSYFVFNFLVHNTLQELIIVDLGRCVNISYLR